MATTTTQTQTILPDWYTQYAQNVLQRAQGATQQPYQTYSAPRIAPFTPQQEQAFGLVGSNVGDWQPALSQATQSAQAGTTPWTAPGVAQSYMNPYTQNVVNDIGTLAQRNLSENLLPAVNRTFVGGGTFGGSRSADFTARAVRDANESALQQQNQALQAGYNQAQTAYGADANRALQGAQVQAGIGSTVQNLGGVDAAALQAAGAQQQQLGQTSADLAYQDFVAQRDYPVTQLQQLTGIGGVPNPSGSGTTTATAPGPNTTAGTIGNILGGIGQLGSIFTHRRGGRVRPMRGIGRAMA